MTTYSSVGYRDLSRLAASILGLAAFTWSAISGMGMIDAVFKGLVVYMVASILALLVNRVLVRMTELTLEEESAREETEEEEEVEQIAEDIDTTLSESISEPTVGEGD